MNADVAYYVKAVGQGIGVWESDPLKSTLCKRIQSARMLADTASDTDAGDTLERLLRSAERAWWHVWRAREARLVTLEVDPLVWDEAGHRYYLRDSGYGL